MKLKGKKGKVRVNLTLPENIWKEFESDIRAKGLSCSSVVGYMMGLYLGKDFADLRKRMLEVYERMGQLKTFLSNH